MPQSLASVDVWVIVIYMASMLWVAWRVSATSRDVEGYTVGNRRIPGWAVGLSILATFTSSISFLAQPAKAYEGNWNVFVFALSLPLAAWMAVRWFVPLYRRGVDLSAYELLEHRFGYWARLYADLSYVVLQLIRVATVLLLVALAVSPLLDWDIVPTLIALGILVIIYDVLGGIQAVIWTDVIQVAILIGGALWCLTTLVVQSGGPMALWSDLPMSKFSLGSWEILNLAAPTVLVTLLYGITENLRNYGTDQNYVQRMLSARSDRDAAGAIWLGALSYLPVSLLFCLIGSALYLSYPPDEVAGILRPDEVFPHFIKEQLPVGISGLVVAAILAAAMSTVDSSLNSTSTVIFVDMVRRLGSGKGRVPEIVILRVATATLGILGTGTAVVMYRIFREQSHTILDMWWQYAGTAGGGMLGLFILAWLAPRVPSWGAGLGVILSIPVLAWGTFARDLAPDSRWAPLECPLHPYLVGISGTAVLLIIGALSLLAVRAGLVRPNQNSPPDS